MKVFGRDLRRNLVSVPSCDQHNSRKSKGDEFFRAVILMNAAQFSDPAKHQFLEKLLRAIARRPHAYRTFFADRGSVNHGVMRALQIDRLRFDLCIDHMARALFFHATGTRWERTISVISPNFFDKVDSGKVAEHQRTIETAAITREYLRDTPVLGENPEVFKFRLKYHAGCETFALAVLFYECFEVFTYSCPEIERIGA